MEKTQIAAPAGWHEFLVELSETAGCMVNGNRLSLKAKELLAAAPAPSELTNCPSCRGTGQVAHRGGYVACYVCGGSGVE